MDEIIELLRDLVRTPSHPGIPRQEEAAVRIIREFLEQRGIACEIREVAPGRPNLVAAIKGTSGGGRSLLLCGHTDTVPPNVEWVGDPFSAEVRDGRMLGRGTADMKGALAAMCGALVSLSRAKDFAGEVVFAAVVDEEMESIGAEDLIRTGPRADGAIVGEPTGNRVGIGHKGLEWLEIAFIGRSTHGGTAECGVNAISAAAHFIREIEMGLIPQLESRRDSVLGPPTLNFGTVRGGDQPSTVAGQCVVQLDRRWVPSESVAQVFEEIETVLAEVRHARPGLRTELRRMPGSIATMEHKPLKIDPMHPLVRAADEAHRAITGRAEEFTVFPAWTDGGLLSNFGEMPTIICGPGDLSLAHSPRESIEIREVVECAEIYRATAEMFCSGS